MSAVIAAKLHRYVLAGETKPAVVTIVDFVTVGAGQVFGVFIRENGTLATAELDSFSDCRPIEAKP